MAKPMRFVYPGAVYHPSSPQAMTGQASWRAAMVELGLMNETGQAIQTCEG